MTMHKFLQKYGTRTVPLLIQEHANLWKDEATRSKILEVARDLNEALEDYASQPAEEADWDAMEGRQG